MQLALITGTIFRNVEIKTSAKGNEYIATSVKTKDGEGFLFWRVTAFSQSCIDELKRLKDGDGVSVQGSLQLSLYQKNGEAQIGRSIVADSIVALRKPYKQRDNNSSQQQKTNSPTQRGVVSSIRDYRI